jgi:2-iminoacetate synthase
MIPTKEIFAIDEKEIHALIRGVRAGRHDVSRILARGREGRRLGLAEIAALLSVEAPRDLEAIFEAAREVKEQVFGKRIVLFAPLYLSNRCANNCLYCGFRRENREAARKTLSVPDVVREAAFLFEQGYRRLLLVAGETQGDASLAYLCDAVEAIYRETPMRMVHVNAAPLSVEGFRRLKAAGAGVYQCFQETYHVATYRRMHPSGPKRDYARRLSVMDRAMEGGFGDVGMGVLFGLYDYRFEALSVVAHALHLEQAFGVGPHTVSVPRLQPAPGAALSRAPHPLSDAVFRKVVAVFRLAIPYAGVVVSTREGATLRDAVIRIGASQISAGSRTDIGGYVDGAERAGTPQFSLRDSRSLDEMVRSVLEAELLPSHCTACYRTGRTGEHFRRAAESGALQENCLANALLSLMEYLQRHGSAGSRAAGLQRIEAALEEVSDEALRRRLAARLDRVRRGEADLHQ